MLTLTLFYKQSWLQRFEEGLQVRESDWQSPVAQCSILPVESALDALPLICSSALMSCRSVYEGPQLGLLVSSECVVQLLSEVRGHLPSELKEGHVQQGKVNGRPGGRPQIKSIHFK